MACLLKPTSPKSSQWLLDNVVKVPRYSDGAIEASRPLIGQIVEEMTDEGLIEDIDFEIE